MSDVADEGRDAAIERCGKQPKCNCFFTYYVLLPLVPAVAVRESERANPGVPVVLRVSRRILGARVPGRTVIARIVPTEQATSGAMQIFSPGHVFYEELW